MRGDASGNTDTPKSSTSGTMFSLTDKDSSMPTSLKYNLSIKVQKPSAGKYNKVFLNYTVNYTQNKYLF